MKTYLICGLLLILVGTIRLVGLNISDSITYTLFIIGIVDVVAYLIFKSGIVKEV